MGSGGLFHSIFSTTAPDYDRSQWLNEKFKLGLDFPNVGAGGGDDVGASERGVCTACFPSSEVTGLAGFC